MHFPKMAKKQLKNLVASATISSNISGQSGTIGIRDCPQLTSTYYGKEGGLQKKLKVYYILGWGREVSKSWRKMDAKRL